MTQGRIAADTRGASLAALGLVVAAAMTGFGVFIPIFPFLGQSLGADALAIIYAMGAYSLGQMLASPAWGRLSDRIGRKPVLILGLLGAGASYLLVAASTDVVQMGLARFFGGLMAGNIAAAFAAAADLAEPRTRARNMGIIGAAFGMGFILGPALGAFSIGATPDVQDFHRVCFYAAGFAWLAALAAGLFLTETHPPARRQAPGAPRARLRTLLSREALLRLAAICVLMIAAQALMETSFGLWSAAVLDWSPQRVGYLFAAFGIAAALMQGGAAGRLSRWFGEARVLGAGLGLFVLGFTALALARSDPPALAGMTLLALSAGLTGPALQSLFAAEAAEDERGAVMGLSQSASALGRVLGPLIAGPMFQGAGPSAPFLAGIAMLVCALALTARLGRARAAA